MFSSGALFGSQATQGFGMDTLGASQLEQPFSPESASKKPRQEAAEACLPVTIRAVQAALEQRGETGDELKFHGSATPQIILVVAAVESVVKQAASIEVVLNDATGRMKGRWFLADPQEDELDRIAPGSYVSAFGEVRASPVQHLALKGMRPIDSADEVSYHMVEAAYAALRVQQARSGIQLPKKMDTSTNKDLTPEKQRIEAPQAAGDAQPEALAKVATTNGTEASAAKPSEAMEQPVGAAPKAVPMGAELRATILDLLRETSVGAEGLHLEAIAQKVGQAGKAVVQAAVAELVDDGELYTTITEEHFAAV